MSAAVENGEQTKTEKKESVTPEDETEAEPESHFDPVVVLSEVEILTNEENEEELLKLRAKLFRFDTSDPESPEWKERGTGEVKLLRHKENNTIRIVMRRDKTLKLCANHFITPWMELKPSYGSNRAWVWTVQSDFADETPKAECLAIRFANAEIATQWKTQFDEAKNFIQEKCEFYKNNTTVSDCDDSTDKTEDDDDEVIDKMANLNVSK